jgi:4,5-DOPA dioxygenase extradiol
MTSPQPAVFVGHGSPMNALEENRWTRAWRELGASLDRPRAVLVVSAHWFVNATAVTAMVRPRTIHDFFGFPEELFAVQYPAPGAPEVAEEVVAAAAPRWVGRDRDSWGLDHGTWSVLTHLLPDADVPTLQLSIDATATPDDLVDLGRRLAPLRERGVLIVGSGNVVHDLRSLDPRRPGQGFDWAERFDAAVREVMTDRPGDLAEVLGHPDAGRAVPTFEHFAPLCHVAGVADAASTRAEVLVEGCDLGSLSMTSYLVPA